MPSVYILLSRTKTLYSRVVRLAEGGGNYTHASLALGPGCSRVYSFSRKYAQLPLPSPLVREDVPGSYMARHPQTPCALYSLTVTGGQYDAVSRRVEEMLSGGVKYRYSLLGRALCALDIAHERGYHFFCSQFVASVLSECAALELPRSPSLIRPSDFELMDALTLAYAGPVCEAPGVEDIFEKGEPYALPGKARAN